MIPAQDSDEELALRAAVGAFELQVGITNLPYKDVPVGNRRFIKFLVGRPSPLYTYALHAAQASLPAENPFRGAMTIDAQKSGAFPHSLEATALLTLITRSTREVSEDEAKQSYSIPYIPFQNREDHKLAQPASHIVKGRRGVGKSTLIRAAKKLMESGSNIITVIDMQTYSGLLGSDLQKEVLFDVTSGLASSAEKAGLRDEASKLRKVGDDIFSGALSLPRAPPAIKRILNDLTRSTGGNVFLFLDDFHTIDWEAQPDLLHVLHACVKGANGWLKAAGVTSLLNPYSARTGHGLQVPGDAQEIPLDLTLENPEAADQHLRSILSSFLRAVGYQLSNSVIPDSALSRLVWATAGVPRDFLQMFARATEHARRNKHSTVTVSNVNIAIGEFGQKKMDDVLVDARNQASDLTACLEKIEELCLDEHKVNGFLVRGEASNERRLVHALSDLRMVHLIHRSITPGKAGERYEAYIIDYSIFTGFRRRKGIREMVPDESQFRAAELRALPKIEDGFLSF